MQNEKTNEYKNYGACSHVSGTCNSAAFFDRSDTPNWFHALSNAYSSFIMWIFLRWTIGIRGWNYCTTTTFHFVWYACDVSKGSVYGI